jgi:hypothetical protein
MPNVEGPDGKVIAFPDSMSSADIDKAMQQMYGGHASQQAAPAPAASPYIKWPAVLGTAAAQGFDLGAGAPGDLIAAGEKYAPALTGAINSASLTFGLPLLTPNGKPTLPTSSALQGATNALGLTGTQLGHPDTLGQRLAAGTVAGATGAIPLALTGDIPGAVAVGGIAGLGSGATEEVFPNNPITSDLAGIATGLAGGSIIGDVRNMLALSSAKRAASNASTALTQAKDARFDGNIALAKDAQDKLAQARQQAEAAKAALTPHIPPYEQIAAKFGPTQTLQEAGEGMQDAGRKWLTTEMPKRQAAAWAPVDKLVPPTSEIELPEYAGALTQITSKGSRLGGDLKSPIFDSLNRRLQGALRPSEDIPGEEPTVKPLTWQDARELRSLIGDAMGDTATVKPIHQQDLANLYRALTHDMGARASEVSPQAAKAFNDANAQSTRLFGFAEGPLAKVISGKKPDPASDPNPEAAARRLLTAGRSGATDLSALRSEMPQAVDGLTAAFMRQQGKQWSNLSPEAKLALAPGNAGNIDAALAKHESDMASFNLAHKTIAGALADTRAATSAGQKGARVQLQSAQRQAQRDLDNANANYNALKEKSGSWTPNLLGGLLGGTVGPQIATAGLHALGLPGSEFVQSAWGGIIGAMAPWVVRSAARTVKHPRLPLAALQGARAGSAATTLRGSQQ